MILRLTITEYCKFYGTLVKISTFNSPYYNHMWWFEVGEYKSEMLTATTRERKDAIVRNFLEEQATPKATKQC